MTRLWCSELLGFNHIFTFFRRNKNCLFFFLTQYRLGVTEKPTIIRFSMHFTLHLYTIILEFSTLCNILISTSPLCFTSSALHLCSASHVLIFWGAKQWDLLTLLLGYPLAASPKHTSRHINRKGNFALALHPLAPALCPCSGFSYLPGFGASLLISTAQEKN